MSSHMEVEAEETLPPPLALWSWCLITAVETSFPRFYVTDISLDVGQPWLTPACPALEPEARAM